VRGIFSLRGFSVLLEFIHFASRLSYFELRAAFLAVSRFTGRARSTSTHVSSFRRSDGISSPLESRLGLSEFEAALTHLATPLLASTFNLQPSTFHIPHSTTLFLCYHNTTQYNSTCSLLLTTDSPPTASKASKNGIPHHHHQDPSLLLFIPQGPIEPWPRWRWYVPSSSLLLLYFIHGGKPPNPRPRCARAQV
jgi:hypothetical protein